MKIIESKFSGVFIIEFDVFNDSRGYFAETFSAKRYENQGINLDFVQEGELWKVDSIEWAEGG